MLHETVNDFSENLDLTTMTSNDPSLTSDPHINRLEGLKVMHIYKLNGYTL